MCGVALGASEMSSPHPRHRRQMAMVKLKPGSAWPAGSSPGTVGKTGLQWRTLAVRGRVCRPQPHVYFLTLGDTVTLEALWTATWSLLGMRVTQHPVGVIPFLQTS